MPLSISKARAASRFRCADSTPSAMNRRGRSIESQEGIESPTIASRALATLTRHRSIGDSGWAARFEAVVRSDSLEDRYDGVEGDERDDHETWLLELFEVDIGDERGTRRGQPEQGSGDQPGHQDGSESREMPEPGHVSASCTSRFVVS